MTSRFFFSLSVALVLLLPSQLMAGLVVNLNGTANAPVINVTVDNADVFTTGGFDILTFHLGPNVNGVGFGVDGPLGTANPCIIRAPQNGSYLNLLRISSGNFSSFTLSQSNPYTSSSNNFAMFFGNISDLAALDGVTTVMNRFDGTGPTSTSVSFNYNISAVPEPNSALLIGLVGFGVCIFDVRRKR